MKNNIKYISNILKSVISILIDFIYPENISCIICNSQISKNNTYSMCKTCFNEMNFILDGCIKCGKPIIYHSLEKQDISGCGSCFDKTFYFDKSISCIEYNNISKKLILDFKYKRKTYMSKYIANIMKEKLEIENIKFDCILYVPLHKKRLKKRGFNQSEKIAIKLGNIISKPSYDALIRKKNTKPLYKLNKEQRQDTLKNIFEIKNNMEFKNKNILLLDDIFTTGSTVNEISKLLKLEGANKIYVMTLLTRSNDAYIKA